MNPKTRSAVLAALDFLEAHPGGKYPRLSCEFGRNLKICVSLNFDTQMEAEDWAAEHLGETYRETAIYSQSFGYLAHDFKNFSVFAHFPKSIEQPSLSGV